MYKAIQIWVLAFTLSVAANAQQQMLHITDSNALTHNTYVLHSYTKLYDLGQQALTLSEFVSAEAYLNSTAFLADNTTISFTNNYYWQTLTINNHTEKELTYYLEVARPITDGVYLYSYYQNGTFKKQVSGDAVPFNQRDFSHRKSIFKVTLPPQQKTMFYLNLKSDGEVLNLGIKLHTSEDLLYITNSEQLVYGLFYGIIFLAFITYLFFYFALRDRTFLYYSIYVISIGLMQFALDGMWFQYLAPNAGMYSLKGVILCATVATLFFGLYTKSYLQIHTKLPAVELVYKLQAYAVGALLVMIALPIALPSFSYLVVNIFALIALFLVITSIVWLYVKGQYVDVFFTIGIGSLFLGMTIFILNNFSLVPASFITENASKLGTGAEIIFLSLSMSNLIRQLKSEKEVAQSIALKKSQDMNEIKSYFMSNMSHELRTPLNAIMGIADVMLADNIDPKIKANFEIIKYSSNSLLSSVNDILDFNQIEKGEIKLNVAEFEPQAVLNQIRLNAEKQAQDKGLVFKFEIEPHVPKLVIGDSMRLTQIINNVLNNAIKFTNSGYVHVQVAVASSSNQQINLQVIISDSGVGIPKDKMDSIYEAFTQETINNKRKFGGLGLGLSIVKKLVDLHEGTILMESKVGRGTKCTIQLPLTLVNVVSSSTEATTPDELPTPIQPISMETEEQPKYTSVLLVEDNSMNQLLMKMIMKNWENTTFKIANHGEECLQMLQQDKYDIILMDLQMPVMDGYEATIAIRSGAAGVGNINIPIIALTADVMEGTEQRVKQIGMDKYLTKPVNQELLLKSVKELTQHRIEV